MLSKLALLSLLIIGGYIHFTSPSRAHSWYPISCCSGQDCEMVPSDAINEIEKGYHVRYISGKFGAIDEIVPSSYVHSSQDLNFHACWRQNNIVPKIICFFAPLSV
jgi:hypothetical protein